MGGCVSRPEGCVRRRSKSRKRRRGIRRRVSSRTDPSSLDKVVLPDRSFSNPTFQGSVEEAWFDSVAVFESDCEDDFQSVQEDSLSLNGSECASLSSLSSMRTASHEDQHDNVPCISYPDQQLKLGEQTTGSSALDSVGDVAKTSNSRVSHSSDADRQPKSDVSLNNSKLPVYLDELTSDSVDASAGGKEGGILDHCGILQNTCLPCLASTVPSIDKRKSLSPSSPGTKKKAAMKLSFRWKEGHANTTSISTKTVLQRPIAGTQVPFCPIEKKMFDCWSAIEPCTFKVRGENYLRQENNIQKEFAPNYAAYKPFGVDVFLSPRKIDHIARFVELPVINSSGKLPPILVVNVQVPLYPATIFQGETDGEGMSIVLYFRLSESYSKELPLHFQENLRRIIDDEVEKVKGFAVDTILPVRERLKILGRVANVDDLQLNAPERKLMHAYNEKPVLSRPQHEFYLGENYLEIDIDMHRFSYISRKGFQAFQDRLRMCVLDVGLTIQGNKAEELPEQILCCIRLNGIDHTKYHQLGSSEEPL
ncbi:protein of unknown function DUF1336 [Macleaya cordata]|uniref:Protein ENHANCED DISEASE RESISTANCE 2 C-terminal domain-containing protein n=1 Tax=Macleaya cordata TaxID=56857 RepID=A0A200QN98_MACCD|nr:protein of unknown function DUF1336 [Macleaya cordata]